MISENRAAVADCPTLFAVEIQFFEAVSCFRIHRRPDVSGGCRIENRAVRADGETLSRESKKGDVV